MAMDQKSRSGRRLAIRKMMPTVRTINPPAMDGRRYGRLAMRDSLPCGTQGLRESYRAPCDDISFFGPREAQRLWNQRRNALGAISQTDMPNAPERLAARRRKCRTKRIDPRNRIRR